jgi:Mn2+/Fe2+ NRAMP family transporter
MSTLKAPTDHKRKLPGFLLRLLGPGLVTGAADDDPSGIATYSQAGAQFGFGLLWTVFLTTPFMIAIQLVSAHIGRVTGKGIAANAKQFYPFYVVLVPVALLLSLTQSTSRPTSPQWAKRSISSSAASSMSTP